MPQSLVKLYAHIVFSTKYRTPWIVPEVESPLHGYMTGIVKGTGAKLVRIGGMPDHVHLLVLLSKTETVSNLLRTTKNESSKWIKGQGPFADFHWQDGYAAFSVSESGVDTCIRYIDNQKMHHARMTFQQELIMLLQKHHMEYDERYLWD